MTTPSSRKLEILLSHQKSSNSLLRIDIDTCNCESNAVAPNILSWAYWIRLMWIISSENYIFFFASDHAPILSYTSVGWNQEKQTKDSGVEPIHQFYILFMTWKSHEKFSFNSKIWVPIKSIPLFSLKLNCTYLLFELNGPNKIHMKVKYTGGYVNASRSNLYSKIRHK